MSWHLAQTTGTKALLRYTIRCACDRRINESHTRSKHTWQSHWNRPHTSPSPIEYWKWESFFFSAKIANQMNFCEVQMCQLMGSTLFETSIHSPSIANTRKLWNLEMVEEGERWRKIWLAYLILQFIMWAECFSLRRLLLHLSSVRRGTS